MSKSIKLQASEALPKSEFPKISAPANRAIINANIKTLKDLSKWTEKDFLKLHGIGPSALPPLRAVLKAKGLSFKLKIEN